jgi:hypothetical protein
MGEEDFGDGRAKCSSSTQAIEEMIKMTSSWIKIGALLAPLFVRANEPEIVISGDVEATLWAGESPMLGLLQDNDGVLFSPRLTLALDALMSSEWYFHAAVRLDRGFDPESEPDGQVRLDELMLRYRPFGDDRMNFQVGKFATAFGNWAPGHEFHDDPFLLAPLPYSQITGIHPRNPGAISQAAIANRATVYGNSIFRASKQNWASTIWGPAYGSGLSVFGTEGTWAYAVEVKNAGLSSLPDQWDPSWSDLEDPTFTARLAYRPDAAWALGLSLSRGSYLEPEGEKLLPVGMDRGDLAHSVIGVDARWAHRDLIISGEIIASDFETLEVGDLRSLSYYLQARWKAAPGFWLAGRFGQTFHNSADGPGGAPLEWAPDHWRAELSAGYRFTPDLLVKAQYSYSQADGDPAGFSNHLAGLGIGWRF